MNDRRKNRIVVDAKTWLAGLVLALVPTAVLAHDGTGLAGGLVSGVLHPLSGPDHMLAMVAVGLWGAILRRPLVVALPVVFPAMMAVGGMMGIVGVPMPPIEVGIGLSVLVLGSVIVMAARPPVWAAILLVAVFAVFHGYAHGAELPSAADPVGYSVGFVLSTGTLHLVGIGVGYLVERVAGVKGVRLLGAPIALAGIWFLYRAVLA